MRKVFWGALGAAALVAGLGLGDRTDAQSIIRGITSLTAATPNVLLNGGTSCAAPTGCTVGTTLLANSQGGANYTVAASDNTKVIKRTYSGTTADTLPNVSTTGFGPGFSVDICTTAQSDTVTVTSPSTVNGSSSVVIPANTCLSIANPDGTNYVGFLPSSGITTVGLSMPAYFSVAGSPLTGTGGSLTVTGASQTANYFLAAPNGSSGAMTPRAIVNADLPTLIPVAIGWIAGQNPNNATVFTNLSGGAYTVQAIVGRVEIAEGATATITVNSAASGTLCSGGTAISTSFNANGSAANNQTVTSGTPTIANGSSICLQTTGSSWGTGSAVGGITVFLKPS